MAKNHSTPLELTIISGEDLSLAGKHPLKKNAFVVIKAESNDDRVTTMDTNNGSYPSWNETFSIDMPMHASFFTLEVHCKNFSGDQVVGAARVPVSDFIGGYFPGNYLHFLSYRLRDRYGQRNGIINLSIKVKSSNNFTGNAMAACPLPPVGWDYKATTGQRASGRVVMGIPVHHRY